jgi:hypothetical protein
MLLRYNDMHVQNQAGTDHDIRSPVLAQCTKRPIPKTLKCPRKNLEAYSILQSLQNLDRT